MEHGRFADSELKVLQRLKGRSIGMTARELARSLKARPSDINQCLLKLQNEGHAVFRSAKWWAVNARADLGSSVTASYQSPVAAPSLQPHSDAVAADRPKRDVPETISRYKPISQMVDRRGSRWSTFRRLCDYYAECVRLDQQSSITAIAADEFKTIVCIDGALPNSPNLKIRTRESWHKWVRKVLDDDYLFVGYPLQRYRWRDVKNAEDIDFVFPVFVLPCRAKMDGKHLDLEAVGPIRINEGWLERRLKNVDERRTFLELCGVDSAGDDGIHSTSWSQCARLLNHFYPDWCAEKIDSVHMQSSPTLKELQKDGIYNPEFVAIVAKTFGKMEDRPKLLANLATS